ncbi:hypothetical protein C3F09_11625 [candidate division GN15 bacterium]|uniref:Uncharacterized protein n=1 Tax=candidate division GN15 bacterium TaxID=2072418 RepID=A0A855X091_9BACT|nr:MAG: hypothetical protein C3F09_11625 [candidate division GN15 bacterium]
MIERTVLHIVSLGFVALSIVLWIMDSFPSVFVSLMLAFVIALINCIRHNNPAQVDCDIERLNAESGWSRAGEVRK